jgi:carboxyl-terminal processing protease
VVSRAVLCAALAAPALALSQPAGPARGTLPHVHRVADALTRIGDDYVDAVPREPLVARCIDGALAWLAERKQPMEAPPPDTQADARIGSLFLSAAERDPGLDLGKLADACLMRVVEGLDRLSQYLDKEAFDAMRAFGPFGAIGIEIMRDGDYTRIVGTIDGTPAARSDLGRADLIVSVDGTSTRGLSLQDVSKLLRGAPGSALVLEIQRTGVPGTLKREFKREIIRVPPVRMAPLEGGLVYLRIAQFQDALTDRFPQAVREAAAKTPGGLKGAIIDLRNNPGGLLSTCVAVAAAFLPPTAMVVELRGRTEYNNRKLHAKREDIDQRSRYGNQSPQLAEPLFSLPLAVLINGKSAACSEILAAAMQDHGRGKVVGEPSFGVGTVQTILPFGSSAALKITTARYFRPNGTAMDGRPVMPDVAVASGDDVAIFGTDADPALAAARRLLLPN